jgi:hypothetical protein
MPWWGWLIVGCVLTAAVLFLIFLRVFYKMWEDF